MTYMRAIFREEGSPLFLYARHEHYLTGASPE